MKILYVPIVVFDLEENQKDEDESDKTPYKETSKSNHPLRVGDIRLISKLEIIMNRKGVAKDSNRQKEKTKHQLVYKIVGHVIFDVLDFKGQEIDSEDHDRHHIDTEKGHQENPSKLILDDEISHNTRLKKDAKDFNK